MSVYVMIGGGISLILGISSSTAAAVTALIKSRQIENPNEKRSLYVASLFIGFSIIFAVLSIFAAIALFGASEKNKKGRRIFFLIMIILLSIFIISGLVTLAILRNLYVKQGRQDEAVALNASIYLVVSSLILYFIAFILLGITIGRKLKKAKY